LACSAQVLDALGNADVLDGFACFVVCSRDTAATKNKAGGIIKHIRGEKRKMNGSV
jgi:hypothetical protein